MAEKTQDIEFIAPLFTLSDMSSDMGKVILEFTSDDYNKKLGSALIDADNDAEAIRVIPKNPHKCKIAA